LLASLDEYLAGAAREYWATFEPDGQGVYAGYYDVIAGLAGLAAYFSTRDSVPPMLSAVRSQLVERLVQLTASNDAGIPVWFTPPEKILNTRFAELYRGGLLDLGLSHGAAGLLAATALLHRRQNDSRLRDAARHFSGFLLNLRQHRDNVCSWPSAVGIAAGQGAELAQHPLLPWCYGAIGIARALWLAGLALEDSLVKECAVDTVLAICRTRRIPALPTPGLCHGQAGVLQIVARFCEDVENVELRQFAATTFENVVNAHFPASAYGFMDATLDGSTVDDPGFLVGAAGVALALLSVATDVDPEWDRVLLLS
jgi:lantibiotic modifying enzyme